MKYILIITFIIGCASEPTMIDYVELQPIHSGYDLDDLKNAAETMILRLESLGIDANYQILPHQKSVRIKCNGDLKSPWFEKLVTAKGQLSLNETTNNEELVRVMSDSDPILAFMEHRNLSGENPASDGVLGTFTHDVMPQLIVEIDRVNRSGKLKNTLLGYLPAPNAEVSGRLILLKKDPTGNEAFNLRAHMASASLQESGGISIMIEFDAIGAKRLQQLTGKNINKVVALVLDNEILLAPKVNEEIIGGSLQISGHFNIQEAKFYLAMIQGPELSSSFRIVSNLN